MRREGSPWSALWAVVSKEAADHLTSARMRFLEVLVGLAAIGAVYLVVIGLGLIVLGLPPSGEEIARAFTFWGATLFYGGVWLALSMMFSVIFRQPATSALAALAIWLFFSFFWPIIAELAAHSMVPEGAPGFIAQAYLATYEPMFARVSPNYLFGETTLALLNPATRSLGPIFLGQLQGALLGAPIPFGQSMLLIWPHFTGLIAGAILLFTMTYVVFQRQEIRA